VKLRWSLLGYAKTSDLIVATDTNFENVVVDETKLISSVKSFNIFNKDQTYFWKTRSVSEDGTSQWSDVWSFTPKLPYIKMVTPNGGEEFYNDTTKNIIRWDKNTKDTVRIELYKNGQFVSIIRDTFFTTTHAYAWVIPKSVSLGNDYKIKVLSISNSSFSAQSDNNFIIMERPISVKDEINSADISEVYPNPMNNETVMDICVSKPGLVLIKVYDVTGKEIEIIVDKFMEPGNYRVLWDASEVQQGIYILSMQTRNEVKIRKLSILK